MIETKYKNFAKGVFTNILNTYTENNFGVSVLKNSQDEEKVVGSISENINTTDFEEILKKLGIPIEIATEIEQTIPRLKESIEYVVQFFEESFETLHDAICSINYQLHADKIKHAKENKIAFEKRVKSKDFEGVKQLRTFVERDISELLSDMEVRICKCNRVPKDGKKMLFGWLKVKEIRGVLVELEETLPIYIDSILLLSRMELYLGEVENVLTTLTNAKNNIEEMFPYDNRMYTLTEQEFWRMKPKEYSKALQDCWKQANMLSSNNQLLMSIN